MQFEDDMARPLLWGNLNFVIINNGVLKMNFKGFIVDIHNLIGMRQGRYMVEVTQICQWWVVSVLIFSIGRRA